MKFGRQTLIRFGASAMALATFAVCSGTASATPAQDKREFSYFLPRTTLSVEIKQQLNSCEIKDGTPNITTTITVTPIREADPDGLVRLDVGSGFLAKRTVKLELNSDGTLASFNSQSEGQGGAVLAAVAKLAIKVATGPVPLNVPPGPPVCTDETLKAIQIIKDVGTEITKLETLIASGAGGDAQTSLLADLRTRRLKLKEQLSLKSTLPTSFAPSAAGRTATIKGPVLKNWFVNDVSNDFSLMVFDDPAAPLAYFGGDGTTVAIEPSTNLPAVAQPNVIYRKGARGIVVVVDQKNAACLTQAGVDAVITCVSEAEAGVVTRAVFPQFSGLYAIRAGKGGLFGSRQATVKFDATGVPSALEYGSTGASSEIASLAGVATDGVQSLRDAPLANLNREIALAEARAKLDALRAAEDIAE